MATARPKKTRTVCISHKEDADGISAAALVKQAFGAEPVLVDYPSQMGAIEDVAADPSLKTLYICDLGLSKKTQDDFVDIMAGLRRRRVAVTYIDHHDISPRVSKKLKALGVKMVHDTRECTSVLAHEQFKKRLPEHASFVAACAAITDYLEDKPAGARLLGMYDRQFALISATVLTYNIVGHQKDTDEDSAFLQGLVEDLAASKYPHEMPGSFEFAQTQVGRLAEVLATVRKNTKKMSHLGHMEVLDSGASGAVNFVMGLSGKDVGVAYKERVGHEAYAVSVRGSKACRVHLGKLVNQISDRLGGSGGGHDRACGASVPKKQMRKFLRQLNAGIKAA